MTTFTSSAYALPDPDRGFELAGSILEWLSQHEVSIKRQGRSLLLAPKDAVTEEMMEIVRAHAPDIVFRLAAQEWWCLWHSMPQETLTRKH